MFRQYHAQQGRNRRTSEQKNAPRAPLAMRIAMRTCTGWRSTASDTDDGPLGHVSQFRNEKGGAGASLELIRGCPGTPGNSRHASGTLGNMIPGAAGPQESNDAKGHGQLKCHPERNDP